MCVYVCVCVCVYLYAVYRDVPVLLLCFVDLYVIVLGPSLCRCGGRLGARARACVCVCCVNNQPSTNHHAQALPLDVFMLGRRRWRLEVRVRDVFATDTTSSQPALAVQLCVQQGGLIEQVRLCWVVGMWAPVLLCMLLELRAVRAACPHTLHLGVCAGTHVTKLVDGRVFSCVVCVPADTFGFVRVRAGKGSVEGRRRGCLL